MRLSGGEMKLGGKEDWGRGVEGGGGVVRG